MALTPRLSLEDSYVTDLRCAICSSTDLSVVHLRKFPDYVSCNACQSAFVVEAGGDWVMYGNITADLPKTRAFALKQWTWLDAVAKRAEDERQEQAEAIQSETPLAEAPSQPETLVSSEIEAPQSDKSMQRRSPDPQPEPGNAEAAIAPPSPGAAVQEPGPAPEELEPGFPGEEPEADFAMPDVPTPMEEDMRDGPDLIEAELPEFSSEEASLHVKARANAAAAPFDISDEGEYEGEWESLFPDDEAHVDTGPIEAVFPTFEEPSPPTPDEDAQDDWANLLDEIDTDTGTPSATPAGLETMREGRQADDTERLLKELRSIEPIEDSFEEAAPQEEAPAADWFPSVKEDFDRDEAEPVSPLDYEVEKRMSSLQSDWIGQEAETPFTEGPLQEEIEERLSTLHAEELDIESTLEESSEAEQAYLADEFVDPEAALFAEWSGHGEMPGSEPERDEPAMETPNERVEPVLEDTVSEGEPATGQRFRVILVGDEITFPQDVCAHCLRRPVSKPASVPGSLPDEESPEGRKMVRFDVPLCPDCRKIAEERSEEEKTDRLQSHLISILIGMVLVVIFLAVGNFNPAEQLPIMIVGLLVIGGIGYAIPALLLLSRHSKHPPPPEATRVLTTLLVQPAGTKATAFEWRNQGYAGLFRQINRQVAEGPVTPIADPAPQAGAPPEPEV